MEDFLDDDEREERNRTVLTVKASSGRGASRQCFAAAVALDRIELDLCAAHELWGPCACQPAEGGRAGSGLARACRLATSLSVPPLHSL